MAIAATDRSPVRCRSRAAILVALVVFGVACHAQIPRRVASDVKSCETQFANCQALLGTVGSQEAKDVVHLAAITPSSKLNGARTPPFDLRLRGLHACSQPVPCRAECARRPERERRGAAGRHRAVSRVERNELRSEAAGLSSAQPCAQAVGCAGRIPRLCPHTHKRPWIYVDTSFCACDYLSRQCISVCVCAYIAR